MNNTITLARSLALFGVASLSFVSVQCATAIDPTDPPKTTGVFGGSTGQGGEGSVDGTGSTDGTGASGTDDGSGGTTTVACEVEGELNCAGTCLEPNVDEHCGACFRQCSAGTTCQETDGVWDCACPGDNIRCLGACIDPTTSDQYCGASGTCIGIEAGEACATGEECSGGSCVCDADHTDCSGTCSDLDTDTDNCGACGNTCRDGAICDGSCSCPTSLPDTCPTACVNFATDADNCGDCNEMCGDNAICAAGDCACPDSLPDMCGADCYNFANSVEACGNCSTQCDTSNNEICKAGSCGCPDGWELCNGKCTDVQNDPYNCGGCYDGNDVTTKDHYCPFDGKEGCYEGGCITGPCDPSLPGGASCSEVRVIDRAAGTLSGCSTGAAAVSQDPDGVKCDKGMSTNLCFEVLEEYTTIRSWWDTNTGLLINGVSFPIDANARALPDPVAGGHCVMWDPAHADNGFAISYK